MSDETPAVVLTVVAESDLEWSSVPDHHGYTLVKGQEMKFTSVDTLYIRAKAPSQESRDG